MDEGGDGQAGWRGEVQGQRQLRVGESTGRWYVRTQNTSIAHPRPMIYSVTGDAKEYASAKNLTGACPHGAGQAPGEYGVQYIPHKVLIGKDGVVVKN